MNRRFYNSDAEKVRTGEQIGAGGEGIVYEVQGRRDLAAKIYHERLSAEKAEKLLALSRLGSGRLFQLSAWPMDVLRTEPDGDVVGFLMKRINDGREVHTLHSPKSRLQSFPEASWAFLIYVAANIVRAVTTIHEHGFVIGDVNPKNILVTKRATVFLLDCDSFQVSTGGKSYRCEGGFPEYTPPELQGRAFGEVDRKPEHDYFGLAVAIFQLLFLGRHPFSGRYLGASEMPLERAIREYRFAYGADSESRQMKRPPGSLSLEAIPRPIAELFRRAFLSKTAAARPGPQEWLAPLESLAKSLKRCGIHSGHHHYQELSECPWCVIETDARIRLFNFPMKAGGAEHFKLEEVWNVISSINPPSPPPLVRSIPQEHLEPSSLGLKAVRERSEDLILAIAVALIGGIVIGLTTASVLLLGLAMIGVIKIARGSDLLSLQLNSKTLKPVAEKIQTAVRESDDKVRELERKWQVEASDERFVSKFMELQNQKETYEKLPQIRHYRLKTLEAKGIGVTHRTRIAVEKEVDELRYRLEHELSTGAFYLSRVKSQIEDSRQRLLPSLLSEKQSLAQAARDWEVASKKNGLLLVLVILVIAFFIGSGIRSQVGEPQSKGRSYPAGQAQGSGSGGGTEAGDEASTADAERKIVNIPNATSPEVKEGVQLIKKEKFVEAIVVLQQAVMKDPRNYVAWEQIGFAQYQLGDYPAAIDALKKASAITESFGSLYTLGLVHIAQKKWLPAQEVLSRAVFYCDEKIWNESYTNAYYSLARTYVELGKARSTIQVLEQSLESNPDPYNRFKLALLYLSNGNYSEAKRHYQILRNENKTLANELAKIMQQVTTKTTNIEQIPTKNS
jgi:DNA-binding helix-hairpin-helix protein with protein kinase domain/tetratricopeptide (TPR) repeat protein